MILQGIIPLLQVGNMKETVAYYEDCLGFTVDFIWERDDGPIWAKVSRADVSFMFTRDLGTSDRPFIAEKGSGVVLYIAVEEIDSLYQELLSRNALIVQDPITFGGRKQFTVGDPNGYIIAFTQPFR